VWSDKFPDLSESPSKYAVDFRDAMIKRDLARSYAIDPLVADKLPKRMLDIWMQVSAMENEKQKTENPQTNIPVYGQ
jgi:hypothetical protein